MKIGERVVGYAADEWRRITALGRVSIVRGKWNGRFGGDLRLVGDVELYPVAMQGPALLCSADDSGGILVGILGR